MRDRIQEFGDTLVVVIAFSTAERATAYQERLAPLTVLIDPARSAYMAYGLSRGSLWKTWGPKMWWTYARLIARGVRPRYPIEDTFQLGGDFVVGRHGRVVYAFRSSDPADRPAVDDLIAASRSADPV